MKKRYGLALALVLAVALLVPACKKKSPGQLGSEGILALVPEGPVVLISLNLQQLASLDFFDKMIKEDWQKNVKAGQAFKDYADFKAQTGIDLQKDLYGAVVGMYGSFESENPDMVGIVNLNYDPAKLLAVFRDKQVIAGEEAYGGLTIYTLKDEGQGKNKDMRLAFLNKANIAFGTPPQVKRAIDLMRRGGKSALQTAALMKYVDKLDKNSMFWLVVGSIPDKVKSAPAGGMMPVDLSKAEAFTAFADYKNKTLSGELRLIANNEAGNKQIADMLNGLKALGAMGASKEPEMGELLNAIQLSSAADHVKLTFVISEELMNKLGAKAKEKAKAAAAPAQPFGE
jgi:hypothetical protein